jgi:TldD protein
MKAFAKTVVGMLEGKVGYGNVRVVDTRNEGFAVKNGRVESVSYSSDMGFGVSVLVDGCWGFSSSSTLTKAEAERVVKQAIEIAKASAIVAGERVRLDGTKPAVDTYRSKFQKDPFTVPISEKIDLLVKADSEIRKQKGIKVSRANMYFGKMNKVFASTDGALIDQSFIESGGGMSALAVKERDVQVRSYPTSFGGNFATKGYEFVLSLDLPGNAGRIAEEAVELLKAKKCPQEVTTIILESGQLALQVHESIGHPVELDRVLGMEASYAGTSFVTTEKLDKFRYGSNLVNVYADAIVEGGLGTFGYDDEGVPGQRIPIVKEGIFSGYLSSRETAPVIGRNSSGAMRAESWDRIPLIRMTNINLEPGDSKLEDMIAGTDSGLLLSTNKSWSIDDKRLNFQFGTEVAHRIKNGKLAEMYKNAVYTGITPEFWGSCDAVAGKEQWRLWGLPNCGKGQPGQTAHVGHGAAPARFRNVRVGHEGSI